MPLAAAAAAALLAPLLLAAGRCPPGTAEVDSFDAEGKRWTACEDLATPGGAVVLVPEPEADGETAAAAGPIWLPKSYEPYNQGTDDDYYYGLGKVLHFPSLVSHPLAGTIRLFPTTAKLRRA